MNTGQIKAEVAAHFDPQANTSGRVLTWINAEYGNLVSRRLWTWTERIASIDAVAGQATYSIVGNASIPDFRSVEDVTWIGQSPKDLRPVDVRLFDDLTTGVSVFATTVGSTSSGAATVNVTSTAGYPVNGYARVGAYVVSYTGTTATTLTGVSGVGGTVAASSAVRSVLTAVNPTVYAIGGGAPEANAAAGVAGGTQTVSLFPAPAANVPGAIQIRGHRGVGSVALSSDSDVPIIPSQHHDVLVELAVARGYASSSNFLDSNIFTQRAEARIAAMQQEDGALRDNDPDTLVERESAMAAAAQQGKGR